MKSDVAIVLYSRKVLISIKCNCSVSYKKSL